MFFRLLFMITADYCILYYIYHIHYDLLPSINTEDGVGVCAFQELIVKKMHSLFPYVIEVSNGIIFFDILKVFFFITSPGGR